MADSKITRVEKLRIEQFWAIPLAGKVVAPCPAMAMPLFLFLCEAVVDAHARTELREESPAGAIDTGMKTFHEWQAGRTKNEGLWLNDKNAVICMSRLNPLRKNSAVNKSLAKKPATAKAMLSVAPATPKPFKAMVPAMFKPIKAPLI